ncbi:MAG: rRNA processing protein RimM [Solirubrobacteraceae bacterium]|nr:rRNA processing protein RimM [Solirubrobacteraceae bacterium]
MAGLDVLNAGRVGRPHGLDGSFHVTRPRPALLALGGEVRIGDVVWEIVRRAGTDDRPILRLHGVDDRAGAEALRGEDLFVARSLAPPLEEGEYWAEDLRGCRVVTAGDRELGVVDELRALPSCEVLEVGEMLVPMVGGAVIAVDVAARRIVVDARFLGLDGSFHVTRARPTLLPLGGMVRIGEAARTIVRRAGTDDRPILRIEGVDDRAGAEALRGEDLRVLRSAAPKLEDGEYWAEDLQGCRIVAEDGRELGVVEGLRALPSCEALEVGELLVPMVADAIRAVDLAARRIVVDADFLGVGKPAAPRG